VTASTLLDRLELVRETGPGRWIARCPSHEDRSPSLSIRETDDGTVLIHDFGGCHALDIVQAVGLELSDLFPNKNHRAPSKRRIPAADKLLAIDHEITVATLILSRAIDGRAITESDWQRLAQARARIGSARHA
jgi:hypothetical protein